MSAEIPVGNLYALLAFHWQDLGFGAVRDVGEVEADTPVELLARALVQASRSLLRRGLAQSYRERREDLRHVRGAIDLTASVSSGVITQRRLTCRIDELTPDITPNRLLKATLTALAAHSTVEGPTRRALRGLVLQLAAVEDVPLTIGLARAATVPHGHRAYAMLLDVCRLVATHLIPDSTSQGGRFLDPREDDLVMSRLFEGFLRGFARYYLRDRAKVGVRHVAWRGAEGPPEALALLPRMITDVYIETESLVAVLEAKFVREPFRVLNTPERLKLRSSHLYQLFAYLANLGDEQNGRRLRGALVYASTAHGLQARLALDGVPVSVWTVDLTEPWSELDERVRCVLDALLVT